MDSISEEGEFIGRTSWDAPDVDPIVFLSEAPGQAPLEIGQMRKCKVTNASIFDLEAIPITPHEVQRDSADLTPAAKSTEFACVN